MIEIQGLTKQYGDTVAVDDVSFTVRPGIVTGFLGPNGAGKSTTMRCAVGLDAPTSGAALINGRRYAEHAAPMREVGALIDPASAHPGRSARNHLRVLAATAGIGRARVDEVLDAVGLTSAADRPFRQFSLGMKQRLGIATALLGDPAVVMLDEPVNGLDPDGVRWVRLFLRSLADEGRTVLLSSHLMSEMAQTADHLVVVARGRVVADTSVADFVAGAGGDSVLVRTPDAHALVEALSGPGITVTPAGTGALRVEGLTAEQVGDVAALVGATLHELTPQGVSLEEAFMTMTEDGVQFHAEVERIPAQATQHMVGSR